MAGIQNADSGEMIFKGQPYQPATMLDAMQHGIGMIVQEAGTVLNITVAENIFIGKEKRFSKGPFVNRKAMEMAAKQAMEALGVSGIDPAMPINKLNFEARKLIEIGLFVCNSGRKTTATPVLMPIAAVSIFD